MPNPGERRSSLSPAPDRQTVTLAGRAVEYRVVRSPRAKYLRLKISPRNGLEVVAPTAADLRDLPDLLRAKQAWILAKLEAVSQPQPAVSTGPVVGSTLSFLGRPYTLDARTTAGESVVVRLTDNTLTVSAPTDDPVMVRACLEAWYRHQARRIFAEQVEDINRSFGFTYQRITIKGQQTRWGSCSVKGNLNFNWRLLMAPLSVIRYVVTHELAHLGELNHSPRFWALVESRCPSYRTEQEWLREHGAALHW